MSKIKYTIEYSMKSIPVPMLWNYISTPNGLEQWFAEKVTQHDKQYTFIWNKSGQNANMLMVRVGAYIRFHWTEEDDKSYFELKIQVSELTDSTNLIITDFAEDDEVEDQKELWNSQIETLQRLLGCL